MPDQPGCGELLPGVGWVWLDSHPDALPSPVGGLAGPHCLLDIGLDIGLDLIITLLTERTISIWCPTV